MLSYYLKSKLHMAVVTDANLAYEGSLTVDSHLMKLARLQPFEKILVANCDNGNRFETYVIEGQRGSGSVCLNGPAALLGKPGDKIIVMAFCALSADEAAGHQPSIVRIAEGNRPIASFEPELKLTRP